MSGAAPTREVAYRVFADEFEAATYTYAESDEERAPQYLVTPTGARVNRVFVVGALTETEEVSDGVLRARIVDPSGAFVCYAGQYQPDALAFFEEAEPPMFVALTGKARTFEPEDSDRIFTSLRPERVNEVDADTRDSWVVQTAIHTLERTGLMGLALEADEREDELEARLIDAGASPALAAGIPRAISTYEPTTGYLEAVQEMALSAVEMVAGEADAVESVDFAPDEGGEGTVLTGFTDITLADSVADPVEQSAAVTDEPATPGAAATGTAEPTEPPATAETSEDEAVESTTGSETAEEPETEPTSKTKEQRAGTEEPTASPSEPNSETPDPTEVDMPSDAEMDSRSEPAEEPDEDELYELSEEERAEVKENFDVGFESGAEFEPAEPSKTPEETDPMAAEEAEPAAEDLSTEDESDSTDTDQADSEGEESTDTQPHETDTPDTAADTGTDEDTETAEKTDTEYPQAANLSEGEVQNLVVNTLQELGDGDGVPRPELIETLEDRHGLSEDAIEDAIEDALLGGRCFESGADALKPI
ncbi:glycerol dehydrogenase [Halodesulfurarchaeum formicicum]|uniref:Glycerol dehydrogenase n=1 Tax=Halodesulfurarchaeum formicicum TaxID=1873524 RepID=A0A1D8S3J3_9EURY|nr:hypothetical protein [Halodesulfurarchaeum formicicum]AOW79930.1 glycerol dehydrogenase [Halodesulfurarchaeum formicicum]